MCSELHYISVILYWLWLQWKTGAAFELWPVNSSPQLLPGNHLCGDQELGKTYFYISEVRIHGKRLAFLALNAHCCGVLVLPLPRDLLSLRQWRVSFFFFWEFLLLTLIFSHYLMYLLQNKLEMAARHTVLQAANVKAFKDRMWAAPLLCSISRKSSSIRTVSTFGTPAQSSAIQHNSSAVSSAFMKIISYIVLFKQCLSKDLTCF